LARIKNDKVAIRLEGSLDGVKFRIDGIIGVLNPNRIVVRRMEDYVVIDLFPADRVRHVSYYEPRDIPEQFRSAEFASFWHFDLRGGDFFIVAEFASPPRPEQVMERN
jgi:hypothetical protein